MEERNLDEALTGLMLVYSKYCHLVWELPFDEAETLLALARDQQQRGLLDQVSIVHIGDICDRSFRAFAYWCARRSNECCSGERGRAAGKALTFAAYPAAALRIWAAANLPSTRHRMRPRQWYAGGAVLLSGGARRPRFGRRLILARSFSHPGRRVRRARHENRLPRHRR